MTDKIKHHNVNHAVDPAANYSTMSVAAHWLGALAVIILFFTHEGEWLAFHTSLGIVLAVPLIARVIWRWVNGFPRPVDQHPSLNLLSRLVMIGMMLSILVLSLTGLLMPLFEGTPYPLFGIAEWTFPYTGNANLFSLVEQAHDFAGHAIIPLFVLHIIGFAKHIFLGNSGNKHRMMKPLNGGK